MVSTCKAAGVGVIVDAVVNHTAGADTGSPTGTDGSSYSVDSFPGVPYQQERLQRLPVEHQQLRRPVRRPRTTASSRSRTCRTAPTTCAARSRATSTTSCRSASRASASTPRSTSRPRTSRRSRRGSRTRTSSGCTRSSARFASRSSPRSTSVPATGTSFSTRASSSPGWTARSRNLRTIGDNKLPSDRAGVFVDNHDTERNGETMSYKWSSRGTHIADAFMLSWPYGAPSVYSGYTWSDKDAGAPGASATSVPDASCASSAWVCTQRWTEIAGMVGFHNAVAGTAVTGWWDDGNNHVAYGRGAEGYVTIRTTLPRTPSTRTDQTFAARRDVLRRRGVEGAARRPPPSPARPSSRRRVPAVRGARAPPQGARRRRHRGPAGPMPTRPARRPSTTRPTRAGTRTTSTTRSARAPGPPSPGSR